MPRSIREILQEFNGEVVEATKGKEGDELKKAIKSVVDELHGTSHVVYQAIFDRGHGVATAAAESDKTGLTTQIEAKDKELKKLTDKIKALETEKPDAAALDTQHRAEMDALREQHKTELTSLKDQAALRQRERDQLDLERALVADGNVDKRMAKVLARDPDVLKRFRYTKDGQLEVLQKDGRLPFAASEEKSGMDLLVAELVADVDPVFIASGADRGSDTGSGGNRGGGNNFFDSLRKTAEAEQKAGQRPEGATSAASRLGVRPATA